MARKMNKNQDVYMEPEISHGKNYTVWAYHPILTEEERERRIEEIQKALIDFYKAVERSKAKANNQPSEDSQSRP